MSELSGSQLRAIREEKHIPLEQVASATRIRLSLLEALEMDEYAELGSRTQARGFLKLYADFLGVPFESPQKTPASAPDTTANLPKSPEAGSVSASRPAPQAAPQPDKKANKLTLHSPQPGKQSKKSKEKPAPTLSPSSPSQQILDEIGRELQNRRKYLDIPWDLLSEQTRIPKKQLVALEQGMLDTFASPSEAKGLLQTYARFLNLDTDLLLIRFADALQERRLEKAEGALKGKGEARVLPPFLLALRRFFTLDLFFGTLLVGGILIFLIWGAADLLSKPDLNAESTQLPEMADVLIGSKTPISWMPTLTPALTEQAVILPSPTPLILPTDTNASVQLVIQARQTVWVRVSADGKVLYQGRMSAGSASAYSANAYIEVETGNVAALSFVFNSASLEPINRVGAVGRLRFDPTGMTDLSSMPSYLLTPSPTAKP